MFIIKLQELPMKKTLLILLFLSLLAGSVFAQSKTNGLAPEKHEENWSDMTYFTVPVLKVLESREAYVVFYLKNNDRTETTVIPKTWAKGNVENPRKLKFRNIKNPAAAYMTIVSKNNEFYRVILTLPLRKNNDLWGVVEYGTKLPDLDKQNLDDVKQ